MNPEIQITIQTEYISGMSSGHEVLTTSGWKPISTVTLEDKVACMEKDKLVYKNPIQLHHFDNYKGRMYKIKNQQIDLEVTPSHPMLVSKRFGRKAIWLPHALEKAKDIEGKHRKSKKDALWERGDYQFILPAFGGKPDKVVDMHSWLIFLGIWIAEGHVSCNNVSITQKKQRVKDELHPVLDKLGFEYAPHTNGKDKDDLIVKDGQLCNYLNPLSVGVLDKYLPEWVWELSVDQVQALIHGLWLGNGSKGNSSSELYYSSSERLADEFMRLCLHAGWSANMTVHMKEGTENTICDKPAIYNHDIYRLGIVKTKTHPAVNHGHRKEQNIQEEEFFDFEGPVYDLSVPSDGFYVRRNGKPCWIGSST